MKKWLLALLTVMVLSVLAACGASDEEDNSASNGSTPDTEQNGTETGTASKGKLVVGTSADYPPFEYVDTKTSEEIIGFDIELIKIAAERLGYEVEVKNMDFNSLITALQAKQFDVVISGMTPTPERDKVVDFSIPYYETLQYMIFAKDKGYETPADVAGGKVGAQTASIQLELAEQLGAEHGFTVESRNLIPELIQELVIGRLDAAVIENIVSENYLKQNADLAAFDIVVDEPDYKAIAFQEGSPLKAEFDKVIEELETDGTIEQLKQKWIVAE